MAGERRVRAVFGHLNGAMSSALGSGQAWGLTLLVKQDLVFARILR